MKIRRAGRHRKRQLVLGPECAGSLDFPCDPLNLVYTVEDNVYGRWSITSKDGFPVLKCEKVTIDRSEFIIGKATSLNGMVPGGTYRFIVEALSESGALFYRNYAIWQGGSTSANINADAAWTYCMVEFTVPAGATFAYCRLTPYGGIGDIYYFRNIRIEPVFAGRSTFGRLPLSGPLEGYVPSNLITNDGAV